MPSKWLKSGSTLIDSPWKLTHLRNRTPMAAILSSRGVPSGRGGFSGRGTQTPTRPHKGAHVLATCVEIEQHIRHPLAGAMIGVLPAAAAFIDREAVGVGQILRFGGGAGGVERRVFQEPDRLGCGAICNRVCAVLHPGHGVGVGDGHG